MYQQAVVEFAIGFGILVGGLVWAYEAMPLDARKKTVWLSAAFAAVFIGLGCISLLEIAGWISPIHHR